MARFTPTADETPFMGGDPNIRRIDLDDAREDGYRLDISGNIFWVDNYSDSSAFCNIEFNNKTTRGNARRIGAGFYQQGLEFDRIYIYNDAQPGHWINVAYYDTGAPILPDFRPAKEDVPTTELERPGNIQAFADVSIPASSSAQIVPANSARYAIEVNADRNNPSAVRVAGSGVGSTAGITLQPGDDRVIRVTDEIHAYNLDGSSSATITGYEVLK